MRNERGHRLFHRRRKTETERIKRAEESGAHSRRSTCFRMDGWKDAESIGEGD